MKSKILFLTLASSLCSIAMEAPHDQCSELNNADEEVVHALKMLKTPSVNAVIAHEQKTNSTNTPQGHKWGILLPNPALLGTPHLILAQPLIKELPTNRKIYVCKLCPSKHPEPEKCRSLKHLTDHMNAHALTSPQQPSLIPFNGQPEGQSDPQKAFEFLNKGKRFRCSECPIGTNRRRAFDTHMQRFHQITTPVLLPKIEIPEQFMPNPPLPEDNLVQKEGIKHTEPAFFIDETVKLLAKTKMASKRKSTIKPVEKSIKPLVKSWHCSHGCGQAFVTQYCLTLHMNKSNCVAPQ